MRAGKLDRWIIIERAIRDVKETGAPGEVWQTFAAMRAEIVQASAQEFMRDFGASSEAATVFRIRYVRGVTVADRVLYAGRVHDLKEIKELGRRKGLELRTVGRGRTYQ